MINLDMVGRPRDRRLLVAGTGSSLAWPSLVEEAAAGHGLAIRAAADGHGPSDHATFFARRIPVLFLSTGLHADYHRRTDVASRIDGGGLVEVLGFADRLVEAAARAEGMAFTEPLARPIDDGPVLDEMGLLPSATDPPAAERPRARA